MTQPTGLRPSPRWPRWRCGCASTSCAWPAAAAASSAPRCPAPTCSSTCTAGCCACRPPPWPIPARDYCCCPRATTSRRCTARWPSWATSSPRGWAPPRPRRPPVLAPEPRRSRASSSTRVARATCCRWAWASRSTSSCAAAANRVFVVLGDGELDEGSVWEAALVAARAKRLDNLVAVVDRNGFQANVATERADPAGAARRQARGVRLGAPDRRRPLLPGAGRGVRATCPRARGQPDGDHRAHRAGQGPAQPGGRAPTAGSCASPPRRWRCCWRELHGAARGRPDLARRWWCDDDATRGRCCGAGRGPTRACVVLTAENRAAIRDLPAALGARFIDVGHLRADDGRHGGRPGAARPHAGGARAGHLPDPARVRVHPHRRRHRRPAGEAGRRRARLPVGGQRAHPPGDRGRGADARHPRHAGRLPRRRGGAGRRRCRRCCAARARPTCATSARPGPGRAPAAVRARPGRAAAPTGDDVTAADLRLPGGRGRGRRRRCWRARGHLRAAAEPAHAGAARRGGRAARRRARPRCWSRSRITSLAGGLFSIVAELLAPGPACACRCAAWPSRGAGSGRRCCPTCCESKASRGTPALGRAPANARLQRERRLTDARHRAATRRRTRAARSSPAPRPLYARARRLIPGAHPDPGQGARPVRARGGAQVPAARAGQPRLGRRRQRIHRLHHGGRAACSLGYAYPAVDEAIRAQLDDGITFSLMHPLEVEVAELMPRVVPGAEMRPLRQDRRRRHQRGRAAGARLHRPRQGALLRLPRLARLVHRRHRSRARASPARCAALTHTFAYNDLASVEEALDDDTACVILEPIGVRARRATASSQRAARGCAARRGALLIFDEMWTGFRLRAGRRPGALRRAPPTWPASPRRSPTACRCRC